MAELIDKRRRQLGRSTPIGCGQRRIDYSLDSSRQQLRPDSLGKPAQLTESSIW
jgi:hypothetical protein